MSLVALVHAVKTSDQVKIVGSNTKSAFGLPVEGTPVFTEDLQGIISYEPDDRVVEVWSGTRIDDLQAELAKRGQCLPLLPAAEFGPLLAGFPGTVGGLISMNMPHGLSSQCGGPKEWTLGAKVVRARGEVVKSGGKVVKNVAGFDFHRFIVGARGSMGLIVSVNLKVSPIKSVPVTRAQAHRNWDGRAPLAIQRVLPADFHKAEDILSNRLFAVDPASQTFWFEPAESIARFPCDWVMLANCGTANLSFTKAEQALFRRAKQAVDPTSKFNPGVLGCL